MRSKDLRFKGNQGGSSVVANKNSLPPLVPASQRHWTSPRLDKDSALGCVLVAEQPSCLGKVAFASLWLLVFAIPWEDAVTISDFGTSARLIGMVTGVFGILAIVERGRVRRPSPGHFLMALFVVFAAVSYLWSLYPEGTLTQALTYFQLFTLVWLIWELSPRGREQKRLMQAYVFGTFVSGIETGYLVPSYQKANGNAYPRRPTTSHGVRLPVAGSSGPQVGSFSGSIPSWVLERIRSGSL